MSRLSEITLLESLTPEELEEVDRQCLWRTFSKGEQIVERASENRDVFFIAAGTVQIVNYSLSGRPVAYASMKAGEFFGELAAIDGEPRSASVVAEESSTIGSLPRDRFLELTAKHPSIALNVMRRLAYIIRACDERIMDLATLGAMQRVIMELVRLATPDPITPGSWLIYPCPAQREIAGKASTTRETVARVFTQLQESNQIRRKGRSVYLADKDELERLAQRLAPGG